MHSDTGILDGEAGHTPPGSGSVAVRAVHWSKLGLPASIASRSNIMARCAVFLREFLTALEQAGGACAPVYSDQELLGAVNEGC